VGEYTHADANSHRGANNDGNRDTCTYYDSDPDSDANCDSGVYKDADADAHAYSDGYRDINSDTDEQFDRNGYTDGHADSDRNASADSDCRSGTDAGFTSQPGHCGSCRAASEIPRWQQRAGRLHDGG
jgi:hypothetical protein